MKRPFPIKILPVAALVLSIMASSACADDHEDNRNRKHNKHDRNRDRNGVNIGVVIPGITVDLYPRQERTVIIERNRRYSYGNSIERDVQRALARNGYYDGPIDGDVGYGTRSAIRSYQYDHGLTPTAHINSELLVYLNLR